ncbi:MAG: flagellar FliJ family protein [Proteobacteria bacterium]|nr:flagellar FliJ family protein [Pseudomonadota bacterium]
MAKSLGGLIRLHEWNVDQKRRKLGELLNLLADLEDQAIGLEEEVKSEQRVASASPAVAGLLYGNYAMGVIERRRRIAESIAKTEETVAAAREDMSDAFMILKKFQTAQENRDRLEAEELNRKEQAVLDEIGARRHFHR